MIMRALHLELFAEPQGIETADKVPGNRRVRIPASAVSNFFLAGGGRRSFFVLFVLA